MMISVSDEVIRNEKLLSAAERAIGDGDHGLGMKRGFSEVKKTLSETKSLTIKNVFKQTGHSLIKTMGGASGPIFGIIFIKGADSIDDSKSLESSSLFTFLNGAIAGIRTISQAKPGDKTVLDALVSATDSAKETISKPLPEALITIENGAKQGMENTKSMVAKIGRATTLAEKTIGHPDPGALSMWIILKAASDFVNFPQGIKVPLDKTSN